MEIKEVFDKVENSKDWREFRVHELGEMIECALEEIYELSMRLRHLTTGEADAGEHEVFVSFACTECGKLGRARCETPHRLP